MSFVPLQGAPPRDNYQYGDKWGWEDAEQTRQNFNELAQCPAASVDNELVLYSGTTGKIIKRFSGTGLVKSTSGVVSIATPGADYGDVAGPASSVASEIALFDGTSGKLIKRMTGSGLVKVASGVASIATGGTDYANASHTHAGADINSGTVAAARLGSGSGGSTKFLREDSSWQNVSGAGGVIPNGVVGFSIGDGVNVIPTGFHGFVVVPYGGTIIEAHAYSSDAGSPTSGSIAVDVWKDTYANFPPTVADSIVASAPISISSATKSKDTTLTGWTTSITSGDILAFNVNSVTSFKRVLVALIIQR